MDDRMTMMAVIHMAKAKVHRCMDCGCYHFEEHCPCCGSAMANPMRDGWYREILTTLTGKGSCAGMNDADLAKVVQFFERAGFRRTVPRDGPRQAARHARLGLMRQIEIRARQVLGPFWEMRVRRFVEVELHQEALQDLGENGLRKVIGWINRTDKYRRKEE